MVLKVTQHLPPMVANQLDSYSEAFEIFSHIRDPKVLKALGPSGVRGLLLKRGKQGVPTLMPANHSAHFDWTYPHDHSEMQDLYKRAKQGQWDGDDLPWHTDVDPLNPEVPLLPEHFFDFSVFSDMGIFLTEERIQKVLL